MASLLRNYDSQQQVSEIPPRFYWQVNSSNDQPLTFPNTFMFTADPLTDILTGAFAFGGFVGNYPQYDIVQVSTTGVLPAPLLPATDYYMSNVASPLCQLSETPGGTPIDILDAGAGVHTIASMGIRHFKFDPAIIHLSGVLIKNKSKATDLSLSLLSGVVTWNTHTFTLQLGGSVIQLPTCNPEFRLINVGGTADYEILAGVQ